MADSPTIIAKRIMRKMGNLQAAAESGPYSELILDAMNGAYLSILTGREFDDLRETQATASFLVPIGSGSVQTVAFSNWANDIWSPVSWYDTTNDRPIRPKAIQEIDEITGAAQSRVSAYSVWGNNLIIAPALSVATTVQLRYISTSNRFTFSAGLFAGTNVFPAAYDELLELEACKRLAPSINPITYQMWDRLCENWRRGRIAPADQGAYFDQWHGTGLPHLDN